MLHRRGDLVIPIGIGRYLADHIPGARLVELQGDDHRFFLGDTEAPLAEIERFPTGTRPAAHPTTTVPSTVLFVAVAGSTQLVARVGDAARASIRDRFLALARAEPSRWGGHGVGVAGDGRCSSPARSGTPSSARGSPPTTAASPSCATCPGAGRCSPSPPDVGPYAPPLARSARRPRQTAGRSTSPTSRRSCTTGA
ncbi:hypothetical protein GCM10027261_38190 [Geodermatophilus arenarius]